ncbi:uncharacterized protein LOC112569665 [Pomacea canaliculata]|uniref:uncharacterized protein LOC112569665 n=1 Tax=Pomacea canaliculata TaxID=400727 RepID=UPI000D739620|nr:uncharacterized protein LOC112569665 [Pomacea canaliculata]
MECGLVFNKGGESSFSETMRQQENGFINISYTINLTESFVLSDSFTYIYETCEDNSKRLSCTFDWRKNSSSRFGKVFGKKTGVICFGEQRNPSSSVVTLDIHVSQVAMRSLTVMKLSPEVEHIPQITRIIRVEVLYPPNVTSLTVEGQEAHNYYLADKGKEVNVSCFFKQGNPPSFFHLLDKHGTELKSSQEGFLSYSLTAQCEDDWPVVRCEGNGTLQNRSVTFLVRCPPQFAEKSTENVSLTLGKAKFRVKAYTTEVTGCFLTPVSLKDNTTRKVNCVLNGRPPDLILWVSLPKEIRSYHENWTLALFNEEGSSTTIFTVIDSGESDFSETLHQQEHGFINISYTIDLTAIPVSPDSLTYIYETCENNRKGLSCTFDWRKNSSSRFGKVFGKKTGVICIGEQRNLRRSEVAFDIHISQIVTRSLSVMKLSPEGVKMPKITRIIRVDVLYPPNITSLTVEGQEANNEYVVDKGKEVNVSCFYKQGNPPAIIRLVDKHGTELKSSHEGSLSYSLTAQCEDDWPVVRCEGNGTLQNKSVTFLVRCPPQFYETAEIVNPALGMATFPVKAYKTAILGCFLTPMSLKNNTTTEANCVLNGQPPDLILWVRLEKSISRFHGNWTLTLRNEEGSSSTTFSVMDSPSHAAGVQANRVSSESIISK